MSIFKNYIKYIKFKMKVPIVVSFDIFNIGDWHTLSSMEIDIVYYLYLKRYNKHRLAGEIFCLRQGYIRLYYFHLRKTDDIFKDIDKELYNIMRLVKIKKLKEEIIKKKKHGFRKTV